MADDPAGAEKPSSTARPRSRRGLRRVLRGLAVLLLIPVLVLGAAFSALAVLGSGTLDRSVRSSGQDAYWLGHAWVDGRKSQADVDALAAQLNGSGIRDLFVHAGPYADDGTLDAGLRPRATWLVGALHTALPGVRVQAWLGNVLSEDRMDLSIEQTRTDVLAGVDDVLDEGFDGVHYDFEPAMNGDRPFLDLLAATHARTQARQKLFSVATPKLEPLAGTRITAHVLPAHAEWTQDYMRQVSEHVDQIAIMAYDTSMPTERTYRGFVRRQTELALEAVPADVTLLIGSPAYHDRKPGRFDAAETVSASIGGVQLALAGRSREREIGLALYVDFDATAQDWESFRRNWAPRN